MQNKDEGGEKPYGGRWTSTYTPKEKYPSAWAHWCHWEMPHWLCIKGILYTISKDARVFIIDSAEDLVVLDKDYGMNKDTSSTSFGLSVSFDFEKMALDYDVINLTEKGYGETHGYRATSKGYNKVRLWGWDCESTLILNEKAIESSEIVSLEKWIDSDKIKNSMAKEFERQERMEKEYKHMD